MAPTLRLLMDLHIDLGQTVIAFLLLILGIVGFLIKMQIGTFGKRLDKHDEMLIALVGDVQRLIGISLGASAGAVDQSGKAFARRGGNGH